MRETGRSPSWSGKATHAGDAATSSDDLNWSLSWRRMHDEPHLECRPTLHRRITGHGRHRDRPPRRHTGKGSDPRPSRWLLWRRSPREGPASGTGWDRLVNVGNPPDVADHRSHHRREQERADT